MTFAGIGRSVDVRGRVDSPSDHQPLQPEDPSAVDHGDDCDRALEVAVDEAVVAEDQLSIGLGRILGHETTRFGERLELSDALAQPEGEGPRVRGCVDPDVGDDPLQVISGDARPDYSSHSASSRMTSLWGMTLPALAASSPA